MIYFLIFYINFVLDSFSSSFSSIQNMSIVESIPSIQIPSSDMLVEKDFISIQGGITPIENDNSTWITVVYELWGITSIENDLQDRIGKLDLIALDEAAKSVINIEEGIRIFEERLNTNPYLCRYMKKTYVDNIAYPLKFKKIQIEMKRKYIDAKKEQLINRMEKFRQDLETRQVIGEMIDKEKKEINKEMSDIRKMGADREYLRQIGRVMKTVYNLSVDGLKIVSRWT